MIVWTGIVRKCSWRWSLEDRQREGLRMGETHAKAGGASVCVCVTLSRLDGQWEGKQVG